MSLLLLLRDTTAPSVTLVSFSSTKISRIAGKNSVDIIFNSNEDFIEYQIRVVPATNSLVTAGTLIEGAVMSGVAGSNYTMTVTGDELYAASAVDGSKIIKVFVKDAAGNWVNS